MLFPVYLFAAEMNDKPLLSWVDTHVDAIKPPRQGLQPGEYLGVQDPFRLQIQIDNAPQDRNITQEVVAQSEEEEAIPLMVLDSVVNGSTALINGAWYRQDDLVLGFNVTEISQKTVLLTRKKQKVLLTLVTANPNIQITAK